MNTLTLDAETGADLDVKNGDQVTLVMQATATSDDGTSFDVQTVKTTSPEAYTEDESNEEGEEGESESGAQGGQTEAMMPGEAMPMIPGPVRTMLGKRK